MPDSPRPGRPGRPRRARRARSAAERFDRAYYERYYEDRRTRVTDAGAHARLGAFVAAYLRHLGLEVERALDLGCGLGRWRRVLARHFPRASYEGVEVSAHLCRELGWRRGSVVDFAAPEPYDLVICQGVLQYLPARDAERALRNLARLCRGALYLEVLTAEDWARNVDRAATDGDVYRRSAAWYRARLARRFTNVGGGLFLAAESGCTTFELERL